MLMSEMISVIEQFCPPSFAEDWDNVGLIAGRSDKEVRKVIVALDATSEVVDEAVRSGADALVTHHPLIFGGIKKVNDNDFVGRRILALIQNDISYYAMHTNFDVMGMADAAADAMNLQDREVLEVTFKDDISHEGLGRIGTLPEHMPLSDCAAYVRDVFHIPHVRIYGDPDQPIVTTAILPGSGHDEIDLAVTANADVMITGDISHHNGIDAVEKGIAVIDAGHYGIEKIFMPYMKEFFGRELPELEVIESKQKEPFTEI